MRILISVQNYHPAYTFGGRVTKAVALAEGLQRLGHSVSVATTSVVGRAQRPSWRTHAEEINGVTVHYLGTLAAVGTSSLNPSVLRFAPEHVATADAAYLIGLYDSLGPVVGWYARRSGVQYAVEPIGMLAPNVGNAATKRLYHRFFGRRLLRHARAIVVNSRIEWADAVAFGVEPRRLVLRRNGVNMSEFDHLVTRGTFRARLHVPANDPLILWVGRIELKKNLDQLLDAVVGLTELPWHLAFVGPAESESYLKRLKGLATRHGVAARTHFVGPLFGQEKLEAYGDATVVALVSVNENWGNTIQEAMAAKVPVLVTDTCGVADLVAEGGGLVVKRKVEAIRDGLRRLLTDQDLYERLRADLDGKSAFLSWDEPVKQMADLFGSWEAGTRHAVTERLPRFGA
jgi:glycosyltransferase involved in cell wall biosynthesis